MPPYQNTGAMPPRLFYPSLLLLLFLLPIVIFAAAPRRLLRSHAPALDNDSDMNAATLDAFSDFPQDATVLASSDAAIDPATSLAAIPVPPPADKEMKPFALYFRGDVPTLWESVEGEIRLNGFPFHVKGTNWFGFETDTRVFHGLDVHSLDDYLDFLRAEQFNLLRLPVSLAVALDLDSYPRYHYFKDPELRGKTVRQILEIVIDEAGARGIVVLLDMHRARDNEKWEVWYTDEYSYEMLLEGWHRLLHAFKHHWNVMGLDLLNEPHGPARWETGNRAVDWNRAAEDMIMKLMRAHPDFTGLFFVEGVSNPEPHQAFWGSNLEGVRRAPLLDVRGGFPNGNKRLVYSPHTYGPSVDNQAHFNDPRYPANLPKIWDDLFGFVEGATGNAVVLGEWGGFYRGKTKQFIDELAFYLLDRCMSDNIWWVLNPNSADTGGLLKNDWTTPNVNRLKVLRAVQPFPSRLFFDGQQYVFNPGAYANQECNVLYRIKRQEHVQRERLNTGHHAPLWLDNEEDYDERVMGWSTTMEHHHPDADDAKKTRWDEETWEDEWAEDEWWHAANED